MAAKDILVKLRLAATDFKRGLDEGFKDIERQAEEAGVQSGEAMGRGFDKGKAAFITAVGAAGAAAVVAIKQSLDLARDLDASSRQIGVSAERLQEWRFAASSAGLAAADLDSNLGNLTQKIGEAAGGGKAAQQAFVDLGIGFQTTTGVARDTDAVMLDLVKRLEDVENPAERARLGSALLGDEFRKLEPLLQLGAAGIKRTTDEMNQFGGALTSAEIGELQRVNGEVERLKQAFSINVARTVSENADAIIGFGNVLADFGMKARNAASDYREWVDSTYLGHLAGNTAFGSFLKWSADRSMQGADQRARPAGMMLGGVAAFMRLPGQIDQAAPPRVTGGGSTPARRGGGGGSRSSGPSAEEREAERAAQKAIENERRLTEKLEKTIAAQRESATVENLRARGQTIAAAEAEAQFRFLSQHPLAIHQTVEALAAALGITRQLTAEDRTRLQLLIDQGDQAEENAVSAAREKEFKARTGAAQGDLARLGEAARREAEAQAEEWRRAHEQAVMDVADLYEDLFTGGTSQIWKRFKSEGLRIIAEIAGAYTLALLSGQGGQFNLQGAFGAAMGRSPLGSLFGAAGGFGLLGGGAANDNALPGVGGQTPGIGGGNWTVPMGGGPMALPGLPQGAGGAGGGGLASLLQTNGNALSGAFQGLAVNQLVGAITGKGSNTGAAIGGALGSFIPIPGGQIIGALVGSLIGGLTKSTPRGAAIIGNQGGQLGVTGFYGNSQSRKDQAGSSAGSLIDTIYQIAGQLGAGVDASKGQVSIGIRNGSYVVDPQGRGYTKTSKFGDLQGFGADGEAATRAALADLIRDGVLTGLSQASNNLLRGGGDLEKQIEKALMIESVPRLLRQRMDPLGAALDELYDKFKLLADAMKEGGASAEQIAQARQLWELEKADTIASIGAASAELKDFLSSLNAGSNSPLSLRQQRAEAEAQLAPYLAQIEAASAARAEVDRLKASGADAASISAAEEAARIAAGKVDQGGFTSASELLLSISRQANASSGAFFSDFDRIRALTGQAIGLVDGAVPQTSDRDPFNSLQLLQASQDTANILADHTPMFMQMQQSLAQIAAAMGTNGDFFTQRRVFA